MANTVNIYYKAVNENAKKFALEETVLLIDSWKDQRSIDIHHASPMMRKIAELREKYDLHMKVERYISDEGGIPTADKAFIKE